ncbi:SDR family NAD(P)-dependent oxidoreductase [Vibrio sp. TRT 17S01]|uniref:SDR family NAD(P)-dependent oxidoreductase n=1 Tax=Vibrio sp. TRT 17S01 TaxID=3418505 RepID=UPI003CF64C21
MSCVFITGATSGIGRQLAIDYANAGWMVVACGRNQSRLSELSRLSPVIQTLCFDMTELRAIKEQVAQMQCSPELWILNAGDCEYIDHGKIDAALIKRVFDTNVIGLANTLEAIQPYFSTGDRVAIVGSIASEVALPRAEAYGASKAAVSYLARSLALDLKPYGIKISTIYPGFVKTPLTDKNTFPMPFLVSPEQASKCIQLGLEKGKETIYFPTRFTSMLRFLGVLPYFLQRKLTAQLTSR